MYDRALFAAIGVMVLIGAVLAAVLIAERRRRGLRTRLAAITTVESSDPSADVGVSLRRPRSHRAWRSFFVPGEYWSRLEAEFAAAGNTIGLLHLTLAALAGAAAVAFAARLMEFGGILEIVLAIAAAVVAAVAVTRLAQGRYQRRFLDIFPDALDLVVRAVRAGLPAFEAIEVAAREISRPVGTELQRTVEEMNIGIPMETALQHTADRIRIPDFRFFVVSLALQRRTGGALAETLGNLATVIRQRRMLRLKARALTAESKASAVVISLMPVVAFGGFWLIAPHMMHSLINDPRGRFMLGVAVISLLLGIALMAVIIKRTLR